MAESTLSVTYDDLRSEIAWFIGWGRDSANWSSDEQTVIAAILKSALSEFYFQSNTAWTFLRPETTLTLTSGVDEETLEDDFGGIVGDVFYAHSPSDQGVKHKLQKVPMNTIRYWRQVAPRTGAPTMYGLSFGPLADSVDTGQRWIIAVYPEPDDAYILTIPYYVNPDTLTASNKLPYGGAQHAETLLACCRMKADSRINDVRQGETWKEYQELLTVSKKRDMSLLGGRNYGQNSDPGMERGHSISDTRRAYRYTSGETVTFTP